jgi:hypothetical protein
MNSVLASTPIWRAWAFCLQSWACGAIYKRKSATDPTKPWLLVDLFNEVQLVAQKFGAGASSKKLHPNVATWLKSDAKTVAVLLTSAGATTSNTAASTVSVGGGGSASSNTAASIGPGGASVSAKGTSRQGP